jgi:hypothetical protein
LSNVRRLAPWMLALWATVQAAPADAQGNIDAGKTPAQIFGDTCSSCHRSARELRAASVSFLRTHYSTGSQEAAAMANYLASVGSDPRAGQPKRQPGEAAKQDAGKQAPRQSPAEQAKAAQGQAKGRPGATAQARPAPEEKPPEPATPALEPFEE